MRAIWNGEVVAESDETVVVEGNHYFPPASVNSVFTKTSQLKTICGWKGEASYFSLEINGKINEDAAWYYPDPKPEAENIRGYIAFWKGVEIVK